MVLQEAWMSHLAGCTGCVARVMSVMRNPQALYRPCNRLQDGLVCTNV